MFLSRPRSVPLECRHRYLQHIPFCNPLKWWKTPSHTHTARSGGCPVSTVCELFCSLHVWMNYFASVNRDKEGLQHFSGHWSLRSWTLLGCPKQSFGSLQGPDILGSAGFLFQPSVAPGFSHMLHISQAQKLDEMVMPPTVLPGPLLQAQRDLG